MLAIFTLAGLVVGAGIAIVASLLAERRQRATMDAIVARYRRESGAR